MHFCRLLAPRLAHDWVICAVLKFAWLMQPDQVLSVSLGSYGGGWVGPGWPARSAVSFASHLVILPVSTSVYVMPLWPAWMCVRIGAIDENVPTRLVAAVVAGYAISGSVL